MIDDPLNRLKVKRGQDLPHSKLTNEDVKLIRELVDHRDQLKKELSGLTNKVISEKFDVHRRTIDRITGGHSWTHI